MGLDATVSYGGPDLVWINTTDTSTFLFSYADMRNRTVYSIIYGVPREDGHTFSVWSELVEELAPPEPRVFREPMWPSGYTRMVITPRTGYNVDVFRQEYDADGNEVGEPVKLYQDKYAAVQGEMHVGTGSPSLPIPQD
jgi:vancomycin resistance protein YoaR